MIKLSLISKRLLSSKGQKISLTILIIGIFFFSSTFAQETTTQTSKLIQNAEYMIQEFIKIMSRSRIVLATLAGKFMTNDMVYGSWLHLDIYLWKLWNICKNFANFGLLGILLRQIIQYIAKKSGSIQSIVTKSVIAGVLIQASWFIVAALLDISSIATAAIASFPTHFIENNALEKEQMIRELETNITSYTVRLDQNNNPSVEDNPKSDIKTMEDLIEKITPKNDSVVGPLIYIGASTLRVQNALNNDKSPSAGKMITTSLLQFLIIGIYCITLALLLIANIIRIGLLRVIIPISPILILMFSLKQDMGKKGIAKNFNLNTILNIIFKPVIFTGVLSLILIFIVTMQRVMTTGNDSSFRIQGTTFSSSGNLATMEVDDLFKTTINDSVFTEVGNTGKNIFSNMIIYFATVFLLRYLVKIAVTSGGGTIGDTMTKATGMVEDMAKTAPLFKGYSWNAYSETSAEGIAKMGKAAGINLNYESQNFGKSNSDEEFKQFLETKLSGKNLIRDNQWNTLTQSLTKRNFISESSSLFNSLGENDSTITPENFERREKLLETAITEKATGIDQLDKVKDRASFKENPEFIKILNNNLNFKSVKNKEIKDRASFKKAYTE